MKSAELRWEAGVDIYRRLGEVGFRMKNMPTSGRVKIARFLSDKLIFDYSIDLLTGDTGGSWRALATECGVPDPLLAICYFSLNPNELNSYFVDDLERIQLEVDVYISNSWALKTTQWARDPGFLRAFHATSEWALKEFRRLAPWEFHKVLFSKRE